MLGSTSLNRRCSEIVGLLDGNEIFQSTARILSEACGVHMSWMADAVPGGVVIGRTSGNLTQVSRGVFLRDGLGLGGKVASTGRIHHVDDYVGSSSITHDYDDFVTPEGIGSMVAAPIAFAERKYGVLFAGYRGARGCGDRSIRLLKGVAARYGEALFLMDRVREATEQAITAERRRTAATVQNDLDVALSAIVKDLRTTAPLIASNYALATRFREIERHAVESAQNVRRSLNAMIGEPATSSDAPPAPAPRAGTIANREYDVLCRVALGETNAEIGQAMNLSCNTVKTYLRNAMSKLGARNRVEAIVNAKELGLL